MGSEVTARSMVALRMPGRRAWGIINTMTLASHLRGCACEGFTLSAHNAINARLLEPHKLVTKLRKSARIYKKAISWVRVDE